MQVENSSRLRSEVRRADRPAILALDTSAGLARVALLDGSGSLHVADSGDSGRHGRGLLPSIRDLLDRAGVAPRELGAIAVGLGPGSFTGLRIGLTAAKTLAYAVQCPVIGLDSFEILARNAPESAERVVIVSDAQRGDLFVARFARPGPGRPPRLVESTHLEPLSTWPATVEPGTFINGPTLGRFEPDWPSGVVRADPALGRPEGRHMIDLALENFDQATDDFWFLEPLYGRRGAAEEKADKAKGTAS